MMYDFSKYFKDMAHDLAVDMVDKYTVFDMSVSDEDFQRLFTCYSEIFLIFEREFSIEEIEHLFGSLVQLYMEYDIPYVLVTSDLNHLKHQVISILVDADAAKDVLSIIHLFQDMNNAVSKEYLHSYIDKLNAINNVRINSLKDLVEKNIVRHYELHLLWLNELAEAVLKIEKENCPQLDSRLCEFGKWLGSDAKSVIKNNSKYKAIMKLHDDLHAYGEKVYDYLDGSDYDVLITYVEKCELISLSIGTELALIDSILMNTRVTKDALTGSLNRQALSSIFESQYELSLATNNSFVLALCDLSDFTSCKLEQIQDIYVLINCAGFGKFDPLEAMKTDDIRSMIDVNLTSALLLTSKFLKDIKKNQGHIINITSIEATRSSKFSSIYTASKAALRAFSLALHEELRKDKVNVTSINPDMIDTPFFDKLRFEPSKKEDESLKSEDIADMIEYIINSKVSIPEITMRSKKFGIVKK
jgi:diguanylate cyclase